MKQVHFQYIYILVITFFACTQIIYATRVERTFVQLALAVAHDGRTLQELEINESDIKNITRSTDTTDIYKAWLPDGGWLTGSKSSSGEVYVTRNIQRKYGGTTSFEIDPNYFGILQATWQNEQQPFALQSVDD